MTVDNWPGQAGMHDGKVTTGQRSGLGSAWHRVELLCAGAWRRAFAFITLREPVFCTTCLANACQS